MNTLDGNPHPDFVNQSQGFLRLHNFNIFLYYYGNIWYNKNAKLRKERDEKWSIIEK